MKTVARIMMVVALLMTACLQINSAEARRFYHGPHGGVDVWIGPGWGPGWGGAYYYPPYYYYPERPIIIERQPDVYIQPPPPAEQPSYWYYCQDSKSYYPYVRQCPGGWLKVVPAPPVPPSTPPR